MGGGMRKCGMWRPDPVFPSEGEAFASHFTSHYDEFANEYKSAMIPIFLMMMVLLGVDRRKRVRMGWVAV